MIAEKRNKSNIGVGGGLVLEIVGRTIMGQGSSSAQIAGGLIVLGAVILFIWGCANYCEGKGYSPWLGLLGLFSCFGLLVLCLLPDKYRTGAPPQAGPVSPGDPGAWPPPPGPPQP